MDAIQENISLKNYNTLAITANARYFVELTDADLLPGYLSFATTNKLAVLVLGGGSNIILAQDFDGLVIKMNLRGISVAEQGDNIRVTAAAGENWHELVLWSLQQGYNGLENLALIPGSVGAAPIQNIGAYGVEFTDVFEQLTGWDCQQQCWHTLTHGDCQFAYRDSIFKRALKGVFIITSVSLRLHTRDTLEVSYSALQQVLQQQSLTNPNASQVAAAVVGIRQSKLPDPRELPNAGSFFKNPVVSVEQANILLEQFPAIAHYPQGDGGVKLAAGWLLEQAGWKGRRLGAVGMHQQQALVLVNYDHADGPQVLALAKQIQTDIQQRFDVLLEIEPAVIGG